MVYEGNLFSFTNFWSYLAFLIDYGSTPGLIASGRAAKVIFRSHVSSENNVSSDIYEKEVKVPKTILSMKLSIFLELSISCETAQKSIS